MNIYEVLEKLEIPYKIHEHRAVFTVKESLEHQDEIPGSRNKSLLLRNKDKSQFYLVVIYGEKRLDQNKLQKDLKESRLSFASEESLKEKLNITPGAVSPYSLINNKERDIIVIVDEDVVTDEKVYFHPDRNTATLEISSADFKKYLEWTGNKIIYRKL